jgi:hypothetical protein
MKPAETLGMIEEAAGTRMFELKKQQSIKIMAKKEAKLEEIQRVSRTDTVLHPLPRCHGPSWATSYAQGGRHSYSSPSRASL